MDKLEFIKNYKANFTQNEEFKLRFKMGGNVKNKGKRISQVLKRFEEISNIIFSIGEVWVILIIWDSKKASIANLLNIGFDVNKLKNQYRGQIDDGIIKIDCFDQGAFEDAEIFYLQYSNYSFNNVFQLVYSSAGFDLAMKNTIGITAYYISFTKGPVLLNLYDDRGMELLSNNKDIINTIGDKFHHYLL